MALSSAAVRPGPRLQGLARNAGVKPARVARPVVRRAAEEETAEAAAPAETAPEPVAEAVVQAETFSFNLTE